MLISRVPWGRAVSALFIVGAAIVATGGMVFAQDATSAEATVAAAKGATEQAESLRQIAAGLAMGLGAIGPGIGVGIAVSGALQALGRNPEAQGAIQTNMIVGVAFAEAIAIYALVVAILIKFV